MEHALLLCPWTRLVWLNLQICPPPTPIGLSTIQQWVHHQFDTVIHEPEVRTLLFITLWNIWMMRNEVDFQNKKPNPVETVIRCNSLYADMLSTSQPSNPSDTSQNRAHRRWSPSTAPLIKINSDATFHSGTGRGHVGIACRDTNGRLVAATSFGMLAPSPIVAEAYALRAAMQFALSINLKQMIFESDNKQLIDACNRANRYK